VENHKKYSVVSAIALVIFLIIFLFYKKHEDNADQESTQKIIKFSFILKNNSSEYIDATEFITNLPLSIDGIQKLESITSTEEYTINEDDKLNPYIKFEIYNFTPYSTKIVDMTLFVKKYNRKYSSKIEKNIYLKEEKYIEKNSSQVIKIIQAEKIKEPFLIYDWLSRNIQDVGYIRENKGARFALEHLIGDCTEHMYAFIAIARNNGIPARGMAGFYVEDDITIANSSLYHNWAEYYDDQSWIISDSQKNKFNEDYKSYIAYRVIGGDEENAEFTNRFMSIDPRISIEF